MFDIASIMPAVHAARGKKRHRLTRKQSMAALACATLAGVVALLTLDEPDPKTWEGFESPLDAALTFLSCPMFDFYVMIAQQVQGGIPVDTLAIRIVRLRYPDAEVITTGARWQETVRKFKLNTEAP